MTVIATSFKLSLSSDNRASAHALSAKQLSHMDLAPLPHQLNRRAGDLPPAPPVVPPREEGPIDAAETATVAAHSATAAPASARFFFLRLFGYRVLSRGDAGACGSRTPRDSASSSSYPRKAIFYGEAPSAPCQVRTQSLQKLQQE